MTAAPPAHARFLKSAEVCRLLNLSPDALDRRCKKGEIAFVWRGSQRRYPAGPILARHHSEQATKGDDDGTRDAKALDMIEAGSTDSEVIRALKLPLERVRALRGAEPATTLAPSAPSSGPHEVAQAAFASATEAFTRRRAELAARRRATLESSAPPRKKKA